MVDACENVSKAYDAAGRLVREGSKTYRYGYLDKVMSVTDGDTTRTFTYHADGQLASASCDGIGRAHTPGAPQTETFLYWAYEVWTSTVIYFDPEATNYIGAIKAPSTTTIEWKEYVE